MSSGLMNGASLHRTRTAITNLLLTRSCQKPLCRVRIFIGYAARKDPISLLRSIGKNCVDISSVSKNRSSILCSLARVSMAIPHRSSRDRHCSRRGQERSSRYTWRSPRSAVYTLTLPVLNQAAHVLFLVSGEDKADIVYEVLKSDNQKQYPAGLVRPIDGILSWFLDKAATARI